MCYIAVIPHPRDVKLRGWQGGDSITLISPKPDYIEVSKRVIFFELIFEG